MDKLILLVADITKDNGSQTISIKNEITEEELNLLNSAFESRILLSKMEKHLKDLCLLKT